jgi:putative transcriptional regulator
MSRVGKDLVEAFQEMAAYLNGEVEVDGYEVPADILTIAKYIKNMEQRIDKHEGRLDGLAELGAKVLIVDDYEAINKRIDAVWTTLIFERDLLRTELRERIAASDNRWASKIEQRIALLENMLQNPTAEMLQAGAKCFAEILKSSDHTPRGRYLGPTILVGRIWREMVQSSPMAGSTALEDKIK